MAGLWAGGLSWRRLGVLLDHLPPESATAAALQGVDQRWSLQDHLLASVVDRLGQLIYVQVASKTPKGKPRPPAPVPLPRPSDRAPVLPGPDAPGIAYLEAKRAQHRAETEGV